GVGKTVQNGNTTEYAIQRTRHWSSLGTFACLVNAVAKAERRFFTGSSLAYIVGGARPTMPPSTSLPTNQELVARAEDSLRLTDPKQFGVGAWAIKATKFFEDARKRAKEDGDIEGAYVANLSGM
ncbi:hypothetical protein HDU93_004372, partial [Gonapodya sp. JEL0774]